MRKLIKNMWISRLEGRVGNFKQCRGRLQRGDEYCCLGVLATVCDKMGSDIRADSFALDEGKLEDLGIKDANMIQNTLIQMNDRDKKSFKEIAQWIKVNL